jgi:hypothetical protein
MVSITPGHARTRARSFLNKQQQLQLLLLKQHACRFMHAGPCTQQQ